MGCDGGTIPTRDELVKVKKKPEKKDKDAEIAAKWQHCQITQEKLQPPIVACEMGRLYKKESVLELLLDRSKFECASSFEHIKGLKDVKELNLTENPGFNKEQSVDKGDAYIDRARSQYVCPVVGLEMNGRYKFCFPWGCGCVVSQRAYKEVKSDVCHKCGKPYKSDDIVILNGDEEDINLMASRMESRRLQAKLDKKSKKSKKHKIAEDSPRDSPTSTSSHDDSKVTNGKVAAAPKGKMTNGIPVKKSKLANGKAEDKLSIQKDPKTSSVYKSLFTTSDEAKNQAVGNWVTFNPQYFR